MTTILIDQKNTNCTCGGSFNQKCICQKIKIMLKNQNPVKIEIQTNEQTQEINKIKISKKSDIDVKFDNFIYPDEYDRKKIIELYEKAKIYYTHYITNFRSLRRVREIGGEILKKMGKNEMISNDIKISISETVSNFSKARLMEAIRMIFSDIVERDNIIMILNKKFKSVRGYLNIDYPASLKKIDIDVARKLEVIPTNNNELDILLGFAQTATNSKKGASIYLSTLFDIRNIIRSYVEGSKQTLKAELDNGEAIFGKINFKTTLSMTAEALNRMLCEFCENHPYQVNDLENQLFNCLINIKATNKRVCVRTSYDSNNQNYDDFLS